MKPLDCVGIDPARSEVGKHDFRDAMKEAFTIEVLDRIISNHEGGIQATGVNVYRQFRALLLERDSLKAEVDNLKGLNEMLEQDLVDRMPPTFCPECDSCGEGGCCSPDACKAIKCLYLDENRRSYREIEAHLSKAEAERDALRQVLGRLLSAKDEKDANGDTPRYRELKDSAWEEARAVLAKPEAGEINAPSAHPAARTFRILIQPMTEGGWSATSDDLPGLNIERESFEGAFAEAKRWAGEWLVDNGVLQPDEPCELGFVLKLPRKPNVGEALVEP